MEKRNLRGLYNSPDVVSSKQQRSDDYTEYSGQRDDSTTTTESQGGDIGSFTRSLIKHHSQTAPVKESDKMSEHDRINRGVSFGEKLRNMGSQFMIMMNESQKGMTQNILSMNVLPKLRQTDSDIENVLKYQERLVEYEQLKESLDELSKTDTKGESAEWLDLSNLLRESEEEISVRRQLMYSTGFGSNPNDVLNQLNSRRSELIQERDNLHEDIRTDEKDIERWKDSWLFGKQRQAYRDYMEGGGASDTEKLWMYDVPGLFGSSSAAYGWQSLPYLSKMAQPLFEREAVKYLGRTAAMTAAGSLVGPPGAAAGVTMSTVMTAYSLGTGMLNLLSAVQQGDLEANAETFEAYSESVRELLESVPSTDGTPYNEGVYQDIRANAGLSEEEKELDDNELLDRVLDGRIEYSNPEFDKIRDITSGELDRLYKQNMALTTATNFLSNSIELGMFSKLYKKGGAKAAGKFGKAAEMILDPFGGAVDLANEYAGKRLSKMVTGKFVQNSFKNNATKALWKAALPVSTAAGFALTTGINESIEEGGQYIYADEYKDLMKDLYTGKAEKEAYGWLNAVGDSYGTRLKTVGSLMAAPLSSDFLYNNDDEFLQNAMLGFIGGAMGIQQIPMYYSAVRDGVKSGKGKEAASNYIRENLVENIEAVEEFSRAKEYAGGKLKGSEGALMDVFQYMIDNESFPEGLTKEDIEQERTFAAKTLSVAGSSKMQNLAAKLNIKPDTEEYGSLVGLAMTSLGDANKAQSLLNKDISEYNKTFSEVKQTLSKEPKVNKIFSKLSESLKEGDAANEEAVDALENAKTIDLLFSYRKDVALDNFIKDLESLQKENSDSDNVLWNERSFKKTQIDTILKNAKEKREKNRSLDKRFEKSIPALEKANNALDPILNKTQKEGARSLQQLERDINGGILLEEMYSDIYNAFFGSDVDGDFSPIFDRYYKSQNKKIYKKLEKGESLLKDGAKKEDYEKLGFNSDGLTKGEMLVKSLYNALLEAQENNTASLEKMIGIKPEDKAEVKTSSVETGGKSNNTISKEEIESKAKEDKRLKKQKEDQRKEEIRREREEMDSAAKSNIKEDGKFIEGASRVDDSRFKKENESDTRGTASKGSAAVKEAEALLSKLGEKPVAKPEPAVSEKKKRKRGGKIAVGDLSTLPDASGVATVPTSESTVESVSDAAEEATKASLGDTKSTETTSNVSDSVEGVEKKAIPKKETKMRDMFDGLSSEDPGTMTESKVEESPESKEKTEEEKLIEEKNANAKKVWDIIKRGNNLGFAVDPKINAEHQIELIKAGFELIQSYVKLGVYKFKAMARDIFTNKDILNENVEDYSNFHKPFQSVYITVYLNYPELAKNLDDVATVSAIEPHHVMYDVSSPEDPDVKQNEVEEVQSKLKESEKVEDSPRVITEDLEDFSEFSDKGILNTFHYDPRSTAPVSIQLNGKREDFSSGSTLGELLQDGADAFDIRYEIADPRESGFTEDSYKYVNMGAILTHNKTGKRFWLRLKSIYDFEQSVKEGMSWISPEEIDDIRNKLQPAREDLFYRLINNDFTRKNGVIVRPATVLLHHPIRNNQLDHRYSMSDPSVTPIFKISEHWQDELDNFGVSRGLRSSEIGIFSLDSNIPFTKQDTGSMFQTDRMGQLFYLVDSGKRLSGRDMPIELSRVGYSGFKGMTDLITNILFEYGTGRTEDTLPGTNLRYSDILGMFVNAGGHTKITLREGASPRELYAYEMLKNKQLYVQDGMLFYGTNSMQLYGISDEVLEHAKVAFKEWFNENVTFPIQLENDSDNPHIVQKLSDISGGRLAESVNNSKNGKIKIAEGIEFSKEDLNKTFLQWAYENNFLLTGVDPFSYNNPFVILEGVKTVSKGIQDVQKDVSKDTKLKDTSKVKEVKGSIEKNDSGKIVKTTPKKESEMTESEKRAAKTISGIKGMKNKGFSGPNKPIVKFTPIKKGVVEKPSNIKDEVKFLKETMGMSDTEIVILDLALAGENPTNALSYMTADAIHLSSNDPSGVAYHEAWHRVSLLLFSNNEREAAYGAYRLKNKSNRRLPNHVVEEMMAEDFRLHGLSKRPLWSYRIVKMFDKIRSFLGVLSPSGKLRSIYDKIYEGHYKNIKPSEEAKARFNAAYGGSIKFTRHGHKFKKIGALSSYSSMLNFVITSQISQNIEEGKLSVEDGEFFVDYDSVKDIFLAIANDSEFSTSEREAANELYENFDNVVKKDIQETLKSKGFREINFTEDDDLANNGEFDTDDEGETTKENFDKYDRAAYESPMLDKIRPAVKFLLSSIPRVVETSPGEYVYSFNKETGLPEYVPFNEVWIELSNSLFDSEGYGEILTKLRTLAVKNPMFAAVYQKLADITHPNLQTQIFQVLTGYKHNFEVVGFARESTRRNSGFFVNLGGSANALASKNVISQWNEAFFNSKYITIDKNSGQYIADIDQVKQLQEEFAKALSDIVLANKNNSDDQYYPVLTNLAMVLNKMGIDVDFSTLDTYVNEARRNDNVDKSDLAVAAMTFAAAGKNKFRHSITSSLSFLVSGTNNSKKQFQKKSLDNLFGSEPPIMSLALVHYNKTRSSVEQRVLGPKNKSLYPFSQHNNLTLEVVKLNEKKEYVKELLRAPFNEGSLMLNFLSQPGKYVTLGTFANFTEYSAGSKGSDYRGIGLLETFITKLAYSEANAMLLPTMSDKKTYMPIHGLPLFSKKSLVNAKKDGQIHQRFSDEVIDQFYKYYISEYNAIAQYNRLKENDKLIPTSKRYLGYFGKVGSDGRGGKFRFAKGYYRSNDDGSISYHSFSKMNASEIVDYFNNPNQVKEDINSMLIKKLQRQLKYMKSLGLISEKEGVLKNTILPEKSINDRLVLLSDVGNERISSSLEKDAAIRWVAADYLVNHMISMVEASKFLHKDPAYYKDYSAVTKRLAGALSTGQMLRTDFPADHWFNSIPRYKKGKFNVVAINDIMTRTNQPEEIYDAVYNAYVNELLYMGGNHTVEEINAIMTNDDYGFGSALIPEEIHRAAVEAAKNDLSPYSGIYKEVDGTVVQSERALINQADGAAYASPTFAKALLMATGKWTDSVAEAFDLLENDPNILKDPSKFAKVLGVAMNPFKMVYYGSDLVHIQGPTTDEVINPITFNKMAIFPLFKHLATGDLKYMYDRMESASEPIDMITMESATKVDNIESYPFYTNEEQSEISPYFENSNGESMAFKQQSFRNLLNQMPIDSHEEERRMFVTQATKTILSNIRLDDEYIVSLGGDKVSITGQMLHDIANTTQNRMSDLGKERIIKELGIRTDVVNGVEVYSFQSYDALSEKLIRDFSQGQSDPVLVNSLSLNDSGEFNVPLSATTVARQLVAKLISSFNKETIDMNLPGGAYIQMSSFGFKGINLDNVVERGSLDYTINNGERLKLRNPDGSMDAIVSINSLMSAIPEEYKRDFMSARKWLIENGIIGSKASPSAIGYRVPVQGLSSIAGITIRDVIPSQFGDVIVLPDEFTARTGSDFDIDKLFFARYNYRNGKKVEYDLNISSTEAMKEGVSKLNRLQAENLLLDTFFGNILSPKSAHTTLQPLDIPIEHIKEIASKYGGVESSFEAFTESEPYFQDGIKDGYASSVVGIGPFALNLPNHVLTQAANVKMVMPKPFANLGDLTTVKDGDGVHTLSWLSAMVSAHVDVANDDYILKVNVGPYSYNMVNFLLRSGAGRNALLFVNQDIFKNLALAYRDSSRKYGREKYKSSDVIFREAKEDIKKRYMNSARKAASKDELTKLKNLEKHFDDISLASDGLFFERPGGRLESTYINKSKNGKNFDYYYDQLYYMYLWERLKPYTENMSDFVKHTQIDTKKAGNNAVSLRNFLYNYENLRYSPFFKPGDIARFLGNQFFDTKVDNSIRLLLDVLDNVSISSKQAYHDVYREILGFVGASHITTSSSRMDLLNAMDATWRNFSMFTQSPDALAELTGLESSSGQLKYLSDLFYGNNNMANRYNKLVLNILEDYANGGNAYPEIIVLNGKIQNMLLNSMSGREMPANNTGVSMGYLKLNAIEDASSEVTGQMKEYWQELLHSTNEELRGFAKDLALYAIFSGNGMNHINSLYNFIPDGFFTDMGYYENVRYVEKQDYNYIRGVYSPLELEEIFRSSWSNHTLVPNIDIEDSGISQIFRDMVYIPFIDDAGNVKYNKKRVLHTFIGTSRSEVGRNQEVDLPIFHPFVKVTNKGTTNLYKNIGILTTATSNGVKESPVYTLVNKKGFLDRGKGVITEYLNPDMFDDSRIGKMSIIAENNVAPVDANGMFYDETDHFERTLAVLNEKSKTGKTIGEFTRFNPLEYVESELSETYENQITNEDVVENVDTETTESQAEGTESDTQDETTTETSKSEETNFFDGLRSDENFFNNESEFPSDTKNHCK